MKVKVSKYFLQIFIIWNNGAAKKLGAKYTFWYIVLLTLFNGDRRIVHWQHPRTVLLLYFPAPKVWKEKGENTKVDPCAFDAVLHLPHFAPSILISQTKPLQIGLIEITCFGRGRMIQSKSCRIWNNLYKVFAFSRFTLKAALLNFIVFRCKLTAWDGLYHDFWERYHCKYD